MLGNDVEARQPAHVPVASSLVAFMKALREERPKSLNRALFAYFLARDHVCTSWSSTHIPNKPP